MRTRDTVNTGARMAIDAIGATDAQRSQAYDYIDDLLSIRRLNIRAKNEWERQNNSGETGAAYERSDRKQERAWAHAQRIAGKRGWKLDAPGLWWIVRDGNGRDITAQI